MHPISNTTPLVSILITAYNREKYIAEAIESVLASTFKNYELIIVDDCSIDNTYTIANNFIKLDNRIIVYQNKINIGQFANRNKAASYATGKYLKYVDSDDTLNPNCIAVMVAAMEKNPHAGLGFCHTINNLPTLYPFSIDSKLAFVRHFFEGGLLFTGPIGLIISHVAFKAVGGFEEFGMPSDNHLSLKLASNNVIVAIEPNLFFWRQHSEQTFSINKKNSLNILHNYAYIKDIVLKYSPLSKAENKKILYNQKKIFYKNLFNLFYKKSNPLLALQMLLNMNAKPPF